MSFLAGSRRGPTSLLPSISPRPRPRKSGFSVSTPSSSFSPSYFLHSSRRRTTFLSLFSSPNSLFVLALAVSIIFFLFVVLQFGFPLFSSPTISTSRHSTSIPRPTRVRRTEAIGNGAAAVDITTKDLYDRIEFADVDGGAWKQGWEVKYAGDEWDNEKLKVFIVPHSHNDPGWKLTVEEYYNKQSKHILDTIVEALSKDRRRKFIWEEISYLERWWREAPTSKKESFTKLVKDGQLEIVGGGWVMNDENIGNNFLRSHHLSGIQESRLSLLLQVAGCSPSLVAPRHWLLPVTGRSPSLVAPHHWLLARCFCWPLAASHRCCFPLLPCWSLLFLVAGRCYREGRTLSTVEIRRCCSPSLVTVAPRRCCSSSLLLVKSTVEKNELMKS